MEPLAANEEAVDTSPQLPDPNSNPSKLPEDEKQHREEGEDASNGHTGKSRLLSSQVKCGWQEDKFDVGQNVFLSSEENQEHYFSLICLWLGLLSPLQHFTSLASIFINGLFYKALHSH